MQESKQMAHPSLTKGREPTENVTLKPWLKFPVQENFLSFFPSLPVQTGSTNYAADKVLSKCEPDECRKYAGCHPVLTPGNSLSFAHMAYASASSKQKGKYVPWKVPLPNKHLQ